MLSTNLRLSKGEFLDIDDVFKVESGSWRWGSSYKFHVILNGNNYINDWLQYHIDGGLQNDPVTLYPAKPIYVTKWVRDETAN